MAHEFGHYHKNHIYKGYKRSKNLMMSNLFLSAFSLYGLVGQYLNVAIYFKRSRNMEKESDMHAIFYSKNNNYNPLGIVDVQKHFFAIRAKEGKHKDHIKRSNLFGTHPLTEKRIKYLSNGIQTLPREGKKDFVVDSVMFMALKRKACDESIFSFYMQNDLSACTELSYLQFLNNPKDEFYLYFLMESLRKQLALFPFMQNERFITQNYKVKGKTETLKSIHHQLRIIYDLDSVQIKKMQVSLPAGVSGELFITNREALNYFISLSNSICPSCYPVKKRLDLPYESVKDTLLMSDLERHIYDLTFCGENYKQSNRKYLPVFFNRSFYSVPGKKHFFETQIEENDDIMVAFETWRKQKERAGETAMDTFFYNYLNYREKQHLPSQFETATQKLLWTNYKVKSRAKKKHHYRSNAKIEAELDLYSLTPELFLIMKKRGFEHLLFVNPVISYYRTGVMGVNTEYKLKFTYYFIDLNGKKIYRTYSPWKKKIRSLNDYHIAFDKMLVDLKAFKSKIN